MKNNSIFVTAIVTAVLTTVSVQLFQDYLPECIRNLNSNSLKQTKPKSKKKLSGDSCYDEELIREQLARNYAFLGEEGMKKVRGLKVCVVGAGGVGSMVCTMLARSGVSRINVIDFDQVSLSSLNRHAVATLKDVGSSKVSSLRDHLLEIAPWCQIDIKNMLWNKENCEIVKFDNGDMPDWIIDCIDNIDTKVDLLAYCHGKKIPVIASGGAGTKSDPTRLNIGDLKITEEDPLIKSVRRRLKKKGITEGILVAFSAEKPDPRKASLLPLPDEEFEKGKVDELSILQSFRTRILPVLSPLPAMFGLTIVSHLLCAVAGYPIETIEGKNRMKIYEPLLLSLASQQLRIGEQQQVPISMRDVPYILEEIFRGKSPILGFSTKLKLSRWRAGEKLSLQNVVVMTKEEQHFHEKEVLNGGKQPEDVYPKEVIELVNKRFEEERFFSQYR